MVLGFGLEENLAPAYVVEVGNEILDVGVTDLITAVEYESADGMADVCKITASNPGFALSEAKVFQPGNELAIWMGYGNNLTFIGRGIINTVEGDFPDEGMPSLRVTAFSKDKQMMDNAPPEVKPKKGSKKKGKGGRAFKDSKYSDAVTARAEDYGFLTQVDTTPDSPHDFIQKAGMNDYEFVQGLSNLTGFVFWVDGDEAGNWTLNFVDPEGGGLSDRQEIQYTFEYNTRLATLLSFQPTQTFAGAATKLVVKTEDPRTGKIIETEVEVDKEDQALSKLLPPGIDGIAAGDPTGSIEGTPASGANVKLFIGDYSIEVASGKKFTRPEQVKIWAAQWFRRHREQFILARGKITGTEKVMARQVHTISGAGSLYNGEYYFTRVRHIMTADAGYICDFNARKILTDS